MNKKQVIAVSTVAAIPAIGLLVFLVLGLLQGMLSDGASVSITLWIVWVLAALASIVIGFLPFAIMFFPGLMPEPATAGVDESTVIPAPRGPIRKSPGDDDEGEAFDEDYEDADADAEKDEGEHLFEDDALEQDFDDEFGDSFDDDSK